MSCEDSVETRQNHEFAALKAIYDDALEDLRSEPASNQREPIDCKISLTPQQGGSGCHEVYAKVDLRVTCDHLYPNTVPRIKLESSKGLSDHSLRQLQSELENQAEYHKGQEVIFSLCQSVAEFLRIHNKPASKSFYDEMLQRQKEKKEKDLQAKLIEEDKERQVIVEEVQRREEMLKTETRLWQKHRYNSENSNENDSNRSNNSSDNSDDCVSEDHKKTVIIDFGNRTIKRGQCLKHCTSNHVVFIGIDLKSGEIVVLSEWIITGIKNLAGFDQEFNHLSKLRDSTLVHYLSFKYVNVSEGKSVVYLLKEFVNGMNCLFFMNEHFNANIQFVKYVAKGVLKALDYLHRHNVVHKDIRDGCVYINEKGNVLLANYSLHRRLTDLSHSSNNVPNYSKKSDIYKFGALLVGLLQGSTLANDEEIDIPTTIPSDLQDFLAKCFEKQEKERWTACQLLNHPYLHGDALDSPARKINHNGDDRNISPDITAKELSRLQQNGQSRIDQEFEFIANLGKGAFGDVIKAQNKLDGCYYAVKRIQLNPKNKQLNKKIVREVKLLSRLNHENIVRYYNSWIDKVKKTNDDDTETESSTSPEKRLKIVKLDEFTIHDNIEELAPPIRNFEVSSTYDSKSQAAFDSDDSSSDEENSWGVFEESDDGIEFVNDSNEQSVLEQTVQSTQSIISKESPVEGDQIEYMYIQMEFCEKSTLRNAIDNSVYQDETRVWRLFREIVEGLSHIHQQGMIHRDLKPVNIFLDSADHVKIGDFGLATNIKTKLNDYNNARVLPTEKEDTMDESKTGLIGTALYVAPELGVASKANYNQKVDIYSLGIIFFEMCYRPLPTTMERIGILTGLRSKDIVIPEDFSNNTKQKSLIKLLLDHDSSERPTSQELLQSKHVPPPVLEECKLRELVRHTLSNPQSKSYKYLVASCFDQTVTPAQDITYDKDPTTSPLPKPLRTYDYVREVIVKIFKQHGAQHVSTPLMMPKSPHYKDVESCVKLMTHFGGIVSLPHDLRVPFARYIAWNNITLFRRYSIERVYREKKVFGFLPRELYECAFDIVTPTPGHHIPDAEVLYVIYEIMKALPGLKNKQVTIRLNHTSLIREVLLHFQIKDKHREVLEKISDFKEDKMKKDHLETYLGNLELPKSSITALISIFSSEFEVSRAASQLQQITKRSSNAKQALQDLKTIAQNADAFGVTYEMVIAPGVTYNIQQYSGMICQFVCELKKKHKHGHKEVLAAGGRYDSMISSYRDMIVNANISSKDIKKQSAVGISLSLDKLVQAVMREQTEDLPDEGSVDVAVSCVGLKLSLKEKTKVLRSLWSVGIRCMMLESCNSEYIREHNIPLWVMLKDTDHGTVHVHSWERDRLQQKTIKMSELVENLQRMLKSWKEGSQEVAPIGGILCKSDSRSSYSEKSDVQEVNVSILFVTTDKLPASTRRRYDVQIRSQLESLFKKLSGSVTVLGVLIESDALRTIASYLEWDTEQKYHASRTSIFERHQRSKDCLGDVCAQVYEQKCKKTKPIVILYNLQDSFHRLII